ncbi:serine/threonine-protein kinase PDIK1L-like, partial [Branchiostoma floridae]|uniref:Serine/threonine-protein kinase PDIK1L-like n=1 Tax=Branchiostoma floridae TaxID=7739 RepID=A0A9J7HUU6_BRAFL
MRVGQYEVGTLLGEGAFGKVYKGKHVTTGGTVAMKQLKLGSYRQLACAQNEVEPLIALKDKSHEHIVKCFQGKVMDGSLWLVLEYCSMGTLNDFLLRQLRMAASVKLRLMTQIADAVSFLHANHIVHRDLKPDNILLTGSNGNPVVKVADFGLAKVCGVGDVSLSKYMLASQCGTEFFMAPEVFTSLGYKMYCDVFSMGVIFVAMIDMRRVGRSIAAFIEGRMGATVSIGRALLNNPPPNLSAHLLTSQKNGAFKKLCLSMLSVNYRGRPKAADVHRSLTLMGGSCDIPHRPTSGQGDKRLASPKPALGGAHTLGGAVVGPVGAVGLVGGPVGVMGAIGGPVGGMGVVGGPVGGIGVVGMPVGGMGMPVGGMGMPVGGMGVVGVPVGGMGMPVGGMGVPVGGMGVPVGGMGVGMFGGAVGAVTNISNSP